MPDNSQPDRDRYFMSQALQQASLAATLGEVPVGAVLIHEDRVIAQAHNRRECDNDPLAHAEILVLRQGAQKLARWRLYDCTLYVTLEPCPMCAGAIVNARIPRVVYGASDPRAGACGTLFNIAADPRLNHRAELCGGVCADEAAAALREFFAKRRK